MLPNKRIKIAKYVGSIDGENLDKFENFLENNDGKVVRIDASAEKISRANMPPRSITLPIDNRDGGGHFFNVTGAQAREAMYYSFPSFHLRGYFIPNKIMGVHQGWVDTELKCLEEEKVTLSDKFEID